MKKKKFLRRNWNKYKRIGKGNKKKQKWRKPRGRDNKMREKRRGYLPEHAGNPWRGEEEVRLLSEFDSGLSIAEIAKNHKRTKGAIRSRLKKLGKIKL